MTFISCGCEVNGSNVIVPCVDHAAIITQMEEEGAFPESLTNEEETEAAEHNFILELLGVSYIEFDEDVGFMLHLHDGKRMIALSADENMNVQAEIFVKIEPLGKKH